MEEHLKKLIQEAVSEALIGFKPQAIQTVPEIMTSKQLAEYMQVSESWVLKNVRRLPRLNVVGTRFRKADIDKWLDDNLVDSNDNTFTGEVKRKLAKSKAANKNVYKVV